jgi:hypothetical protein
MLGVAHDFRAVSDQVDILKRGHSGARAKRANPEATQRGTVPSAQWPSATLPRAGWKTHGFGAMVRLL